MIQHENWLCKFGFTVFINMLGVIRINTCENTNNYETNKYFQ
jgi:hypothetical protein